MNKENKYFKHKKNIMSRQGSNFRKEPPDSFDILKTTLPKDTRQLGIMSNELDNFYLKLNKGARFEENLIDPSKSKFEFFKTGRKEIQYQIRPFFGNFNFQENSTIYKDKLKKLNFEIKSFTFDPIWRLIVGLGYESVYETSITLHHIYGIPYIPGSAIKGVVRSWVIQEHFKKKEGDKNYGALSDLGFCRIFGSQKDSKLGEHKGSIYFFDAFPIQIPNIDPDVMNPHYQPYYSDEKGVTPPADYHNPVPVFFLTIKETPFEFHLGIKDNTKIESGKFATDEPQNLIKRWIQEAFSEHGIGAKTAVGYGYMEIL